MVRWVRFICDDQRWHDQYTTGLDALRAHPFGGYIPPRGQLGQAKGTYAKRTSRLLEVLLGFFFCYTYKNQSPHHTNIEWKELTSPYIHGLSRPHKGSRCSQFPLPYTVAVFSPPTSPSPLLFPVGLAALAMKSFSSFLTAALFVVGVSAQLKVDTPSVLLVPLAQFCAYTPQGSPLSPILLAIYILPLLRLTETWRFQSLSSYVDDGAIVATGTTHHSVAQKCADSFFFVADWLLRNGLRLDPDKTEFIAFQPCHANPDLVGALRPSLDLQIPSGGTLQVC